MGDLELHHFNIIYCLLIEQFYFPLFLSLFLSFRFNNEIKAGTGRDAATPTNTETHLTNTIG